MKLRLMGWLAVSLYAAPPGVPRISEDELRANLSFLASDLLDGRSTPSPGQAIAAEFIASRFRLARLEPAAHGGYCQAAEFGKVTPAGGDVTLFDRGRKIKVASGEFLLHASGALKLDRLPLVRIATGAPLPAALSSNAAATAVLVQPSLGAEQRAKILEAKPALLVTAREGERPAGDPAVVANLDDASATPRLSVWGEAADRLREIGDAGAALTVHAPAPQVARLRACNMAAVLPGSDPALAKQYVLVSAHYDHLADAASGADRIFNGANDDGSGTVSLLEIARVLAAAPVRPRRSLLFVAFTGEELGLLGSRYYARHPLVPLEQTVAQINLEQLGRTSDKEGFPAGSITFTGFEFTDLPHAFESNTAGVRVFATKDSDDYFGRSDNQPLADAGIPAATVAVAFTFPDYHTVSDEWQKIEFPNMARVDQAILDGILAIANRDEPPRWNAAGGRTKHYRQAYSRLHPGEASH